MNISSIIVHICSGHAVEPESKSSMLVEAAKLYYVHRMSQQHIAEKLGTSRPTVSRLLSQARDEGIVRIEIIDPARHGRRLENALMDKFRLRQVVIVPADNATGDTLKKRLGQAAALALNERVFNGCILGVSWGTTMHHLMQQLRPKPVRDMKVVQIVGGISQAEFDPHASEIAQKFGENYQARSCFLLLPAIVDNVRVKQAMESDTRIRKAGVLMKKADIIVCSVGVFTPDSLLIRAEYFSPHDVGKLKSLGTVGDICSRMVGPAGEISWPDLDARTVAIELADLKKADVRMAVAGGMDKRHIIKAALLGGYFNILITDDEVAEYLIEQP